MAERAHKNSQQEWVFTKEQEAMMFINTAFHYSSREMTYLDDALFTVLINEAIREDVTKGSEIAWRALELGGWKPQWVIAGEISYIGIAAPAGDTVLH